MKREELPVLFKVFVLDINFFVFRMRVENMESEIQRRIKEVLFPARETLNSALGMSSSLLFVSVYNLKCGCEFKFLLKK
jgi:hypothetical protein